MARKLERLNLLDEHFVKILAVKKINEEWFLLFSAKDAEEKKQQIQAVLATKDLQETEEMPDFSQYREQGRKKEQVLPCGTILNGQYQVLDCVGIGGFGIVYLCQDLYLETTYRCEGIFSGTVGGAGEFLCFCKVFGQAECISLWSSVFLRRGKDDGKIFKYTAYRHNL